MVRLVLQNADLVQYYKQLFSKKQALSDPRVSFDWISTATFQQNLLSAPEQYSKDCVIVDEGDTILVREVNQQLNLVAPKHLLLLSAVPRDSWSGTQKLSFSTIKGHIPRYLDARSIFPAGRSFAADFEPELLPLDPAAIVKFADRKAKEQPVIFWGQSSVYADLPAFPKTQFLTPVAVNIRLNAHKFFEDLNSATKGFYFLEADDERDLEFLRGVNYRSRHPKGLCLMLAHPFSTKSDYLQAIGRVKRGTDDGQIWVLQCMMWLE